MPGLRIFKNGFYQNIGANEPILEGTVKLGCTRGRGSSTRIYNYCRSHSSVPSVCINDFTTILNDPRYKWINI